MAFPAIARTVQVFRRWDATRRWITLLKILEKFTVSDSSSFVGTQLGKAEKDICTFTTFDWLDRVNRNAFFYSMKALYALHRRHFCHTAAHECLTIRVNLASRLSWEIASCSQKCSNTRIKPSIDMLFVSYRKFWNSIIVAIRSVCHDYISKVSFKFTLHIYISKLTSNTSI